MLIGIPREKRNILYVNMLCTYSGPGGETPSLSGTAQAGSAVLWQDIVVMSSHQVTKGQPLFLGTVDVHGKVTHWYRVEPDDIVRHSDPAMDLAVCRRPQNLTGHRSLVAAPKPPTMRDRVTVDGFSELTCVNGQWTCQDKGSQGEVLNVDIDRRSISYGASTIKGVSGAPVVFQGMICGIHVQGSDSGLANLGVLIQKGDLEALRRDLNC
jgi:hypothetical protein